MSNSFVRRDLGAFLVIFLYFVRLASAGEPQWIEVRSPHFSVVTDGGEKRGRETAMRFEQMRAVFGTLMAKGKVNLPIPLQIVAFRNTRELRQFAPLWKGKPTEVSGLFQSGADRSFIMLDLAVEDPWMVVFHEYAHQLMQGNIAVQMDPWFEEGFAEYFSSIEVDKVPAAAPEPDTTPTIAAKEQASEVHPIPASTSPKFLKGQLLSVDCSHAPGAILTVLSEAKTLKMKVADTQHAIVIGADNFSCSWTHKKVAVNYRISSEDEMKVMTVEIQ